MWSGEVSAWEELARCDPADICQRAAVGYDPASATYLLPCFGGTILVKARLRELGASSPRANMVVETLGYYSRPAILYYLLCARDAPLSGELVKPYNMGAGQIYFSGTHQLPLERLTAKFESDIEGFFGKGAELGGERLAYGDASLRLFSFPRLPVALILWRGDDEFPARADLLFDSSSTRIFPPDILWAAAMVTLLAVISPTSLV